MCGYCLAEGTGRDEANRESGTENCPEMPSELSSHSTSIETGGQFHHYGAMAVKYMALFNSRNIFLYVVLCAFRAWSTDEIKLFGVKIKAV